MNIQSSTPSNKYFFLKVIQDFYLEVLASLGTYSQALFRRDCEKKSAKIVYFPGKYRHAILSFKLALGISLPFILGFLPSLASAEILAIAGSKNITSKYFISKYSEVKKQSLNAPLPRVFLEDLIRYEIGIQEANKKKLKNDPIVIDRFNQELYKALIEKELGKDIDKIKITKSDLKKFYKSHPEIRTSHILIEFKPGSTPAQKTEARKRAQKIYQDVKRSKRPFAQLAKLYSDDAFSKLSGGDIGFQSKVTLFPTYYDAVMKMKVGQIKGLVQTKYGFHIVKLTDRRPYKKADKKQLRVAVFDEKRKVIFNKYFKKLKRNYKISINQDALDRLPKKY